MKKKTIYDNKISKKYAVKLEKLKEGEKLSIVSDAMFKTMFQSSGKEKYACYLIAGLTDYSYEDLLENISIVKNELDKDNAYKKGLRCDFVADIRGDKISIEMNNNTSSDIIDRNIEYAFRLYTNKGSRYDYNSVIQINLNNYALEGNKNIVEVYTIKSDDNQLLTNKFMVIQVYLANLREKWYTSGIESLSDIEKAMLVFIEPSIADSYKLGKDINIMEEFIKDAIKASSNDILLEAYDKEWALKDEGKREGYNSGYNSGYDSGYDSGFDDGIEQRNIEMVRNMLIKNLDVNLISEITGLSLEEIEEIKNNA